MITLDQLGSAYLAVFPEPPETESEGDFTTRIPIGNLCITLHIRPSRRSFQQVPGAWRILLQAGGRESSAATLWERAGDNRKEAEEAFQQLRKYLLGLSAALTMTCGLEEGGAHKRPSIDEDMLDELIGEGPAPDPRPTLSGPYTDLVDELSSSLTDGDDLTSNPSQR